MNVYLNGRFLTQTLTGVQRYALEILKAWDELLLRENSAKKFILLSPVQLQTPVTLQRIESRQVGKFTGHLWEQWDLPRHSQGGLLVNFCGSGPAFKKHQITTIHDVAFMAQPENFSSSYKKYYRFLLRRQRQVASHIVTVSEFSKRELVERAGFSPATISIIPPAAEHLEKIKADEGIFKKLGIENQPYLLALSSLTPNKNFLGIIGAFQKLPIPDLKLVLVGGHNSKVFQSVKIPSSDKIIKAGYLSDEAIKALYLQAQAFVFPSFYEGFGIPPLEALSYGCPVVVSQTASMPEVCGDAAVYCDPKNIDSIAQAIEKILLNPALREELRKKGPERAKLFSWQESARKFMALAKVHSE